MRVDPIRRVVEAELHKRECALERSRDALGVRISRQDLVSEVIEHALERKGWAGDGWNDGQIGPRIVLAFELGLDAKSLWRLLNEQEFIAFDRADQIITAIDPMLWHTDPELNELWNGSYMEVADDRDARGMRRQGGQKQLVAA